MKSQSGQVTIEAVLILAIIVIVSTTFTSMFRNNQMLSTMIERPWNSLAGVIQNGNWGSPQQTMRDHPNFRGFTTKPD